MPSKPTFALSSTSTEKANELQINLLDSGRPFDDHLPMGYGLKSVHQKLTLVYPDQHEISFLNHPQKMVSIKLFQS